MFLVSIAMPLDNIQFPSAAAWHCHCRCCSVTHSSLYCTLSAQQFTRRQYRGRIQRKTWCMGPYAGVDYKLTLCPLRSRLQHIYQGQPYIRVDLTLYMSESTLAPSQGLWIWPQHCYRSTRLRTCNALVH